MLDFIKGIWADLVEYFNDWSILVLDGLLTAAANLLEEAPPPEFMSRSIGEILGPSFDVIGYFLQMSGINDGLAVIATAITFRISRKILTLGLW